MPPGESFQHVTKAIDFFVFATLRGLVFSERALHALVPAGTKRASESHQLMKSFGHQATRSCGVFKQANKVPIELPPMTVGPKPSCPQ
jgi:hypothetical protein